MSYTSEVLADTPAGYWRLGEASTATPPADASGNGRTGTYTAGVTLGRTSLIATDANTCMLGPNSAVGGNAAIAYASWMNSASISIEFWMHGTAATVGVAVCRDSQAGTRVWQVQRNSSGKIVFTVISGANPSATSSASVNDGGNHHIVITYDGTTCKIYIDKVLDTTATLSQAIGQPTQTGLTIGNSGRTTNSGWNADIDEVAFYTTILSSTRVGVHYDAAFPQAYTGTAAPALTIGATSAGRLGRSGAVARTLMISAVSAGRLGISGGTTKALTLAAISSGVRGKLGAATPALTIAATSAGVVASGAIGQATRVLTIAATSAAALGVTGQATKALTVGATSDGVRGKVATASKVVTIGATSAGVRGRVGGASPTLTFAAVSAGTVASTAGSSIRLADGTTLINPRYADGSNTLIVRGWLDPDGVTIHPFA